jgi:hypothetical protein
VKNTLGAFFSLLVLLVSENYLCPLYTSGPGPMVPPAVENFLFSAPMIAEGLFFKNLLVIS